jgi:LuxR family maltose regulon positive regulatory protein
VEQLLDTKLYIPPTRPEFVPRPRLVEQLNQGLYRRLTLISAPAGFGKTTLVSEWLTRCERPASWLSLDEEENDPTRFLTYLVAALQTIFMDIGGEVLAILQSPQLPPTKSILTTLLNEITAVPHNFVLVLDDYHLIDSKPVDNALTFLLEHLPPRMHLVIATREDPQLPLARLRARGQLIELRAADLRFTPAETAEFLNQVMKLSLSGEDIAALDTRTEGWIAGLQLAALALQGTISIQGHPDASSFIKSFTGSHHFVLDYLLEEVLQQQSESIQNFLLRTSILERMCGPLCDAVLLDSSSPGQETLEYLERANLFIVSLDDKRRWYRYHHLFAELLRQRAASSIGYEKGGVAELYRRASLWYEENGLDIEAFQHAAAANDIARAERLIEGKGMPLHFRGAVVPVLNWLESLPTTVLDAKPSLWTTYASVLLVSGQTTRIESTLQAAEKALDGVELNDVNRDLIGRIAAIRATLAANQYQVETVIAQSRRALEYLHPDNLSFRTFNIWKLGFAYQLQGDRTAAGRAYTEAISISQASGNIITTIMATIGLGSIQEAQNQLYQAVQTYRHALQLFGDHPLPVACEVHLGLARICYEWNDLEAAEQHRQQGVMFARRSETTDRFVACEVFLAKLKLAQGDLAGAADILAQAEQFMRQQDIKYRMHEIAAIQVRIFLCQGNLAAAARLAQVCELSIKRARVYLAQGEISAALEVLEPLRFQMEEKGWQDERLRTMVLQAVALHAYGEKEKAVQLLGEALAIAHPGGFIRTFVDEGEPMRLLILDFKSRIEKRSREQDYNLLGYINGILAAFGRSVAMHPSNSSNLESTMIEPLSPRELEVLQLIAEGLSNREISERLFLALSTVKGHSRIIFSKLQVQRRTEAVARARQLNLL